MNGKPTRHESWVQRTEAAYRRMFEGQSEEELVTFTQREDMAVLIAKELAAFLLEEHAAVRPQEASLTCCPKCGREGAPAAKEDKEGEELPERTVTMRSGDVSLRRKRSSASTKAAPTRPPANVNATRPTRTSRSRVSTSNGY